MTENSTTMKDSPRENPTSKEQELTEAVELHRKVMDEMEAALRHVRDVIHRSQEEDQNG
jgi:hypothetical protein